MNRRLCVWVVSIFTGAALVGTAVAQALPGGSSPGTASVPPAAGAATGNPASPGASAGPTIPVAAETAAAANSFAPAIRAFIVYQLNILAGSDFPAQTAARDAIRKVLTRGSTPSYYSVFSQEWTAACMPLLTKSPPVAISVRLNIGIITATLIDNGQTMDSTLSAETLVNQLLVDDKASVSLWGIKAARPLVMLQMQGGTISTSKVVANIVNAVKKHKDSEISGFITEDAYSDLAVKEIPGQNDDAVKKLQPPLVDSILDILEVRVAQYKDKAGGIASPGAERTIATFLSGQYKQVSPATQKRMLQLLVNLATYAGKRSNQYTNKRVDLSQLRDMLKYVTSALKVIADNRQVDTQLSWLSALPVAATPPDIFAHTKDVPSIIKGAINSVTEPPAIPDMDPPAFEGSAPATGGGATSAPKP